MEIKPLSPRLGAVISAVDINQHDDPMRGLFTQAFAEHSLLVIRDQKLTPQQLVDFASTFGPFGVYPFAKAIPEHPNVIAIAKEADQKTNFGGIWHTDTPYMAQPSMASVLYARELPPVGGDTLFTNAALAYDLLSDGMKAMLANLRVVNSSNKNQATLRDNHLKSGSMAGGTEAKEAIHPLVRKHPVTGKPALYLSPAHAMRFDGMTVEESKPLIDYLSQRVISDDIKARVVWEPGTVVIWDNRCTLHYPLNDYHGHRRELWRVTVDGEVPLAYHPSSALA